MNEDLKTQLATLEQEFAKLEEPLIAYRKHWEELREEVRDIEQKMADFEKAIDNIRHSKRYKQLAEQLPHLRKAVGK